MADAAFIPTHLNSTYLEMKEVAQRVNDVSRNIEMKDRRQKKSRAAASGAAAQR